MIKSLVVKIVENKQILPEFFTMTLEAPEIAATIKPGQFVMLKTSQNLDPFLKRPISINKVNKENGTVTFVYQLIGKGTKLLSQMDSGEEIEMLGPLGQGFYSTEKYKTVALVGGGCGIAPLLALAEELINEDKNVYVLLGAQNKNKLLNAEEFVKLGCTVEIATDDGSYGQKGFVTSLLEKLIANKKIDYIYCCGPTVMSEKVANIADKAFIPCQLSFEERMACGIGACIGCVIKIREANGAVNYKKVCKDGPVFTSKEVVWNG